MGYTFTVGEPITEEEALAKVAAMGMHGFAFDNVQETDEELHWHEFAAVTWVISGSGSFEDEHGTVRITGPGCHADAPAGWLHRTLAGTNERLVIGTDLPYREWTMPINKEPSERPASLAG
jgi:hypothetical protein